MSDLLSEDLVKPYPTDSPRTPRFGSRRPGRDWFYTYIAWDPETGLIKIGYTGAPRQRLTRLRKSAPQAYYVGMVRTKSFDAAIGREGQLHRACREFWAKHREGMEWFRWCSETASMLSTFIDSSNVDFAAVNWS